MAAETTCPRDLLRYRGQTVARGVASPDTLLSRSRYLLQCLASIIAASGTATTVARNMSVVCCERVLLEQQQGQLLPKHTATP
eukprot:557148-Pleurochrysis_carterae.AAC.1